MVCAESKADMSDEAPTADAQQPPDEVWALVVRALPHDVPGEIRMRRWLKVALRGYGIRVESVGSRLPAQPAAPPPTPKRPRKPRVKRPRKPRQPDDLVEFVEATVKASVEGEV
jgi:hypothetical protein